MIQFKNIDSAFSKKATVYDSYGMSNEIIKHNRDIIRGIVLKNLPDNGKILELNGGTGSDALFFVNNGFYVHLIDISEGMIQKSKSKLSTQEIEKRFKIERKSFENLNDLPRNTFDYIFSNFGGLNCTPNVKKVIQQFPLVLKDQAFITLVIMPPICPWELLNIFWNPKMALRRLPSLFGSPIKANVSGTQFLTYYYSVNKIKKLFDSRYKIISLQSISLFSPPSFLDYFPIKYPKLFKKLLQLDNRFSKYYPFNFLGDFFVLTLQFNRKRVQH